MAFIFFYCILIIISVHSYPDESVPMQHIQPALKRCVESMTPPCVINKVTYVCADHLLCGKGSFGSVFKVRRYYPGDIYDPIIYALKLGESPIDKWSLNNLNEPRITDGMQSIVCPNYLQNLHWPILQSPQVQSLSYCPTVSIYNSEYEIINKKHRIAMIMWYYEQGSAFHVQTNVHLPMMIANRDGYVYKLMHDISFVLEKMWQNKLIDRDVRLTNIMMAGDLRYYTTTTFIKIDYGTAIDKRVAIKQIVDYTGRETTFCNSGSHASPIDIRIMYGKTYRKNYTDEQQFEKQIEQLHAAKIIASNLESVDIIDLVACAASFYDKLTINIQDKINFRFSGINHSETTRRAIVEHNWMLLNEKYDIAEYTNPFIPPQTIKDLIIKIYWLSFFQLPGNQMGVDVKEYLNWNTVRTWLEQIFMNMVGSNAFEGHNLLV
eukprot:505297_1